MYRPGGLPRMRQGSEPETQLYAAKLHEWSKATPTGLPHHERQSMTGKSRPSAAVRRGAVPQQDRAIRTHRQILLAAAEIFARHGYARASVQAVAERAGVTKGAVYFRYPTKQSLAVGVTEEHYTMWLAVLNELRDKGLSPFETAAEMLNRAAIAFRDDPLMQAGARLQFERDSIDSELTLPCVDWISLISSLLTEARDEGQLREGVDPITAANVLVAGLFGVQHVSAALHSCTDITGRWQDTIDLLRYSICA